ncbi:site-specific integrase [Chromobacterium haemolyticum]|uniref:Site-specific integrase n=1 Tax=Chromobacterium fluminis TaxID=3044269 RepID=A0ABX0L247_9NEIS|nr:site-specific integrase [Chromobacterium haemolyticum]NHR05764.1 site-specific integrase [Chromobacterium haemolyticum]
MPIYQRGKTWWCDFATPGGSRVRQSLGTRDRTQAQELYDKLKSERWRVEQLGETPAYTWDEACVRYLREKDSKKSLSDDVTKIKYFTGYFRGRELRSIKRDEVMDAVSKLVHVRGVSIGHRWETGKPVSDSTKNRYLAFASALFRLAANEWEWIPKAPVFKKRKEAKSRIRWLKKSEAARLLSELAPHLRSIVQFALATGFRHANIIGLEWSQVNLVNKMAWIHPDQAKAGEAIGMPLNATALEVLVAQVGKHPKYVFTYRGSKLKQKAATGFKNALKRAGINNFRFHDLRHTWASWLVQAGVPLHIIQELGGWHSIEMVKRYAHLAPEHLREHVESIDSLIDSGTNLSQVSLTEEETQTRKKALFAAAP